MSAPSFPTFARQALAIPPITHGSRYELDCECALTLLAVTCAEQEGRLHMLTLLSAYLASEAGGRKRQFVAKEMQALRDLYEAVWCELGCAFNDDFVRMTRRAVERNRAARSPACHQFIQSTAAEILMALEMDANAGP